MFSVAYCAITCPPMRVEPPLSPKTPVPSDASQPRDRKATGTTQRRARRGDGARGRDSGRDREHLAEVAQELLLLVGLAEEEIDAELARELAVLLGGARRDHDY